MGMHMCMHAHADMCLACGSGDVHACLAFEVCIIGRYHKSTALAVMVCGNSDAELFQQLKPSSIVPAALLDLGWLLSRLFDFWRMDPLKGPPPTVLLRDWSPQWSRIYTKIGGCVMNFSAWLLGTTLLPECMGTSVMQPQVPLPCEVHTSVFLCVFGCFVCVLGGGSREKHGDALHEAPLREVDGSQYILWQHQV